MGYWKSWEQVQRTAPLSLQTCSPSPCRSTSSLLCLWRKWYAYRHIPSFSSVQDWPCLSEQLISLVSHFDSTDIPFLIISSISRQIVNDSQRHVFLEPEKATPTIMISHFNNSIAKIKHLPLRQFNIGPRNPEIAVQSMEMRMITSLINPIHRTDFMVS